MKTLYLFDVSGEWTGEATMQVDSDLHGLWNGSVIFDGARAISGRVPDLLRHCERIVRWAPDMMLESPVSARKMAQLALEGVRRFPANAELYIRPMLYGVGHALFPPESTKMVIQIQEYPLPREPVLARIGGVLRRPDSGVIPIDYKAGWLYTHCLREIYLAKKEGFNEVVMSNPDGYVAEFAGSNLFTVFGETILTPRVNGSFLPGVTRRRVIELLRGAGVQVLEEDIVPEDLMKADEVFSTGNMGKIRPVTRIDTRELAPGRMFKLANRLYGRFSEFYSLDTEEDEP